MFWSPTNLVVRHGFICGWLCMMDMIVGVIGAELDFGALTNLMVRHGFICGWLCMMDLVLGAIGARLYNRGRESERLA